VIRVESKEEKEQSENPLCMFKHKDLIVKPLASKAAFAWRTLPYCALLQRHIVIISTAPEKATVLQKAQEPFADFSEALALTPP
jgi:hypothetical protein